MFYLEIIITKAQSSDENKTRCMIITKMVDRNLIVSD